MCPHLKIVLKEAIELKMRSLGRVHRNVTGVLTRRDSDTGVHGGKTVWRHRGWEGV